MASAVSNQDGAVSTALTTASRSFDSISGINGSATLWKGPRADRTLGAARSYVAEFAESSSSLVEGAAVMRRWATRSEEIAGYMRPYEATRWEAAYRRSLGDIEPELATADWQASDSIATLNADWQTACTNFSAELASWIPGLEKAAQAVPLFGTSGRDGLAYYALLADYARDHGLTFDEVDPSGQLGRAFDDLVNELETTPEGALVWLLIETSGQGDLLLRDGQGTNDDLEAAMDEATALAQVEEYERRTGVAFDPETKRRLVAQIVATATTLHASGTADGEPLSIANSIPPPGATPPDDPHYRHLIDALSEGNRGYLATEIASASAAEWQSMVEGGSQIVDGQTVIYFDITPSPGAGVVVVDYFIPSVISGPLAGDNRDFEDPVFGDVGPDDSRVVLVMDLEQGRASIHVDDTEVVSHAVSVDAHHIELDNDSNAWDETMVPDGDTDMQVAPDLSDIDNTAEVDLFLNQVTVGYDMVNSITPIASTDGTFTLVADENGTFEVTNFNADEYPSIGIYQYQPNQDGGITTTTVIERESRGVMYTFPWWNDAVAYPFESVIRPANSVIQGTQMVIDELNSPDQQIAPGVEPDPNAPIEVV